MKKRGGTLAVVLIILGVVLLIGLIIGIVIYSNNSNGSSQDIELNENQLSIGKTVELDKSKDINFEIDGDEHKILIDSVDENSVSIIIRSKIIRLDLLIGETKNVDLDEDGYYDLRIKLRGIDNEDVRLFIKEIDEKINGGNGGDIDECVQSGELAFDESTGETLGECCEGLEEIGDVFYDDEKTCEEIFMIVGYGSICSDCGNDVCEDWENRCNCAEDCEVQNISECAKQGEQFSKVHTTEFPTSCCEGLTEWDSGFDTSISIGNKCYDTMMASGYPVGTCIKSGDGVCGDIEDVCNSPTDCSSGTNSNYASVTEFCNTAYDSYCEDNPFKDELDMCNLCPGDLPTPECAKQGEWYDFTDPTNSNECCEGIDDVHSTDSLSVADECYWTGTASGYPGGVCSNCGNGICESVESVCGCAEDCIEKEKSSYQTVEEFCSDGYNSYCDNEYTQYLELCELCSQVECSDTDGGANYYVKGVTEGFNSDIQEYVVYGDFCKGDKLQEHKCSQNLWGDAIVPAIIFSYNCPNGCEDGACTGAGNVELPCVDSDNTNSYTTDTGTNTPYGDDRYETGYVEFKGKKYFDYCYNEVEFTDRSGNDVTKPVKDSNGEYLQEFACINGNSVYMAPGMNCPNGCSYGECI
ncbi:hypothetical protein HOE04_05310 [archaeon]|jgi:hypothetical protein|nr:hypothetical protein [archaeon]